jgi:hypothetical protein
MLPKLSLLALATLLSTALSFSDTSPYLLLSSTASVSLTISSRILS